MTADEIGQVIGYSSHFNTKNVSRALDRLNEQSLLQVANKIYVKGGSELNPVYETSVKDDLKSGVESLNFGQSVAAAKTINDWIETKTNHKIKDMVSADKLNANTKIVLVNAVYFKANWSRPFGHVSPGTFTNDDMTEKTLEFMKDHGSYKLLHSPGLSAQILKMEYADTNIAIYLVVPDAIDGLPQLEQNLDQLNFNDIEPRMESTFLELLMPRFEFEYDVQLNEPLKQVRVRFIDPDLELLPS